MGQMQNTVKGKSEVCSIIKSIETNPNGGSASGHSSVSGASASFHGGSKKSKKKGMK